MLALVYPKGQLQFSKIQYSVGKIHILLDRNRAKLAFLSLILSVFCCFLKNKALSCWNFLSFLDQVSGHFCSQGCCKFLIFILVSLGDWEFEP